MKELLAISANIYHVMREGDKLEPQIELIMVASEPVYRHTSSGGMVKERVCTEFRASLSLTSIDSLIESLQEYRESAEEEAGAVTGNNATNNQLE